MKHAADLDDAAGAPLTLVRAAAVRPPAVGELAHWREDARAAFAAAEPSRYRGLTEMMFAQTACDAAAACARRSEDAEQSEEDGATHPQTRFRDAGALTQFDLARAALAALLARQDAAAVRRCRLAVYGAASVDEHFFASTITRLAAGHDFVVLPHFGLGQLQGATLPAAIEMIDAMLPGPADAALFIGAEKWALPFPRDCDGLAALSDGAAALWFARGTATGLRYAGGRQQSFAPFTRGGRLDSHGSSASGGDRNAGGNDNAAVPRIERAALLDAAAEAITRCLAAHGLAPGAVDGWIGAGLHPALDRALRRRLHVHQALVIEPAPDDGYLGAAAAPVLLADVLERIAAGEFADGALLLSWGASFGGGIGVALWRVTRTEEGT